MKTQLFLGWITLVRHQRMHATACKPACQHGQCLILPEGESVGTSVINNDQNSL
jgi:hypothetical protein